MNEPAAAVLFNSNAGKTQRERNFQQFKRVCSVDGNVRRDAVRVNAAIVFFDFDRMRRMTKSGRDDNRFSVNRPQHL